MNHTFDGDLDISLIAPSGEIMLLSGGNGGGSDNYIGTVFNNTRMNLLQWIKCSFQYYLLSFWKLKFKNLIRAMKHK